MFLWFFKKASNCNFIILKDKENLSVYVKILNLTINDLRSIEKGRNIDDYKTCLKNN